MRISLPSWTRYPVRGGLRSHPQVTKKKNVRRMEIWTRPTGPVEKLCLCGPLGSELTAINWQCLCVGHTHMCTHMHGHVHAYMHVHTNHMCVPTHIPMYLYTHICMPGVYYIFFRYMHWFYLYTHACWYTSMRVHILACMYLCVWMHTV